MKTIKTFTQAIIIFTMTLLINPFSEAQQPDLMWKFARSATNGSVDNLLTDSVGNVYITGRFYSDFFAYQGRTVLGMASNSESNVFLLKVAPTGRMIWLHSIRSLNPDVSIETGNMAINQRGELVTVFTTTTETNFQIGGFNGQTNGPNEHTLVTKISKTGYISWVHELKAQPDTTNIVFSPRLFIDEEGITYVSGSFEGDNLQIDGRNILGTGGDAMLFITKILPDGAAEWLIRCDYDSGDNGELFVADIVDDGQDGFYIGGYVRGNRPFRIGNDTISSTSMEDAFLARYMKDRTPDWGRVFSGDSIDYLDQLVVDDNGDVFLSGMFNSGNLNVSGNVYFSENGDYDMFLAKYSQAGDYRASTNIGVWKENVNSTGNNLFMGKDSDGNLIVCSEFYSPQVFITPFTLINPNAGTSDMLMAKLDGTSLDPIWTMQGTSDGHNYFEGASISNTGEVYFTGTSYNKLNVTPETVDEFPADGAPYVVKINSEGMLDYLYWQPNTADNHIMAQKVASDKYGNTYVAGNFVGPDNALEDNPLTQPNDTGLFIARYSRVRNVSGKVFDEAGNPVTQGYVKIYGCTFRSRSPLNDSVYLDAAGSYLFENIPYGRYILVAMPIDELAGNYVPTYYPSFEYWEFTEQVTVNATSVTSNRDISLQPVAEFEGFTRFEGTVQDADEEDLKSTFINKAKPAREATVVMAGSKAQKSTYEIVATAQTDASGYFEFYDINDGEYYMWVDIPGLPVEDVYWIEVAGHQFVSSLDYLVTEEAVVASGEPNYSSIHGTSENKDILVYPIPARDFIIVELKNSGVGICDLYDSHGRLLKHVKLTSKKEILDISDFPAGNYFMRIMTDNYIDYRKINFVR